MTIQEFHINFNIELDKTLDFEYAYIQPEQIDYWLNKAQDRFIKQRLYPQDPRKKGFEENQKRIDDLKDISKISNVLTPVVTGTTYKVVLPTDYFHLVRHRCTTTNSCGTKQVGGIQVQQDDLNTLEKDPFWKPIAEEPLFYLEGNTIVYENITGFTIDSAIINYIKIPAKLRYGTNYSTPTTNIECELLGDSIQHEILDIAIAMVLENIESQRYQTNLNELTKTE